MVNGGWLLPPMLWADGDGAALPGPPILPPHLVDGGRRRREGNHGVWDGIDFDFQFLLLFLLGGESRGVGRGQIDAMRLSPLPELMAHFRRAQASWPIGGTGGVVLSILPLPFSQFPEPIFCLFTPPPLIRVIPVPLLPLLHPSIHNIWLGPNSSSPPNFPNPSPIFFFSAISIQY